MLLGEEVGEQIQMIQQMLRSYCDAEIAPKIDALEDGEILPYEIMRHMADTFGLREMMAPKESGEEQEHSDDSRRSSKGGGGLLGAGADPMMSHVVMMELSRVSPGLALSFGASIGLTGGTIMARGTREQKKRWGKPLFMLDKIGAWGLTEPGAGSDAFGSMTTRARPTGDGQWVLNGQKTYITNAPYADICVVYAKLQIEGEPTGAFVVEAGTEGLTLGPPMAKMGMCESPTGELFLEDVTLSDEHLLGGDPRDQVRDASRDQAKSTLKAERSAMPAMAAGIVERCLEICIRYVDEREQFGQPIGNFQAVQIRLARIYMIRETMISWLLRLSRAERKGLMTQTMASAAKLYCGQAAVDACLEAIQILGGFGYMREGRVEKLMRDAKLLQIGGGTDDIQMLRIARAIRQN